MKTTQVWALIQEWMDAQFFKVTQAQLAQKVGVSRSALSQWKTGQARPKPEHLLELHRVTRIDYNRLVEALVQDMGYRDVKAGEELAGSPSITTDGDDTEDAPDAPPAPAGSAPTRQGIQKAPLPKKRSRGRTGPAGTGSGTSGTER